MRVEHHKRENVACPVCDVDDCDTVFEPWISEDDPKKLYGAASGIPGTQRIVKCRACGMLYENPRFPESVIIAGYEQSEEGGHDSQYAMRVRSFHSTLVRLRSFLPPQGSRVLDVGTAGGAFLTAAEQYGYIAYGLEPSQYLVDQGKARNLRIEQGTIERHALAPNSFDMVCLWDVIEHLPDPKRSLTEVRKLLKPDGILLINYPDIGTWQAKLAGRRFWWILSVHLHHFSRRSIADICSRTGFHTFHFRRYWQVLEFGYLERMAVHYRMPLAAILTKLTPSIIQRIPIPYYASQTTALARLAA